MYVLAPRPALAYVLRTHALNHLQCGDDPA
jgi:hypothetical protein